MSDIIINSESGTAAIVQEGSETNIVLDATLAGEPGTHGSVWYNADGVPDNSIGVDTDYYLDDVTGNVYQRISGVWVQVSNIIGPTGVGTINNFNSVYIDQSPSTGTSYGALIGNIDGSNTLFKVKQGLYVTGSLRVVLNGQVQTQGASNDWVETAPSIGTFTFNTAPSTGSIIQVTYVKSETTSGSVVESIVPGTNISVDNTDPFNPVVSATGSSSIRTTRFVIAPYGDTRPADYTCANNTANDVEINAAITAANALANGGVVDLLDGNFYLSASVIPLNKVWVRGQGMFKTRIHAASPNSTFPLMGNTSVYSIPSNPWSNAAISDIELDGTNLEPGGYKGLDGHGMQYVRLERIYCHDTTASGLGFDYPYKTVVSDNIVIGCGFVNKHSITAASWASNTFTFTTSGNHNYTAGIQATGTLAASAISNNDTVTLASATYTFKTTLTGAAYEVLINGSVANALINLQKAVNLTGTAGTDYGTGTLINASITAGTATSTTIPLTAKNFGTGGNTLATTTTGAGISFGGSTLTGGVNASKVVIAGMLPNTFNGIYNVTSIISSTQFTIGAANNSGTLTLAFNPGTATQFGSTSDSNIGHNGIGIASGGLPEESLICTNNICVGNQNNNLLIEADATFTGLNSSYIFANNTSLYGGSGGFRNTASRNTIMANNYDYGSLIGYHVSSFAKANVLSAASWSAGVATFTTTAAVGFIVGQHIGITGMNPTGYNGFFTVTSVGTNTFTVAITSNPGTAIFDPNAQQPKATYINNTTDGMVLSNNIGDSSMLYALQVETYCDNYTLNGNIFRNSTHYGMYLQAGHATISGGQSYGHGRDGIRLTPGSSSWPIDDVDVSHLSVFDNGKLTTGYGLILNSTAGTLISNIAISDIKAYDDQPSPTQTYGVFVNTPGSYSNVQIHNIIGHGNITRSIQVSPTQDGIYVDNNIGTNPRGKVTLGSITGSTAFDCTLGDFFTGTLAGNVTAVFNASTTNVIVGTQMTLVLTQDATGGRTLTLPSNAAAALGGLTLSTAANAVDSITFRWDGTKWREISRALGSAPSTFSNPLTTLGDIMYENSTPSPARLAGSTSATKMFLSQTGTGSVSAAPAWLQPAASDLSNGVTGTGAVALATSPAITTPQIITGLNDVNGNPWLKVSATASAIGGFIITNGVSGSTVTFANNNTGNAATLFKGAGTGVMAFRPGTDSTGAFQLQQAGGAAYVSTDSTNLRMGIGSGTAPTSTLQTWGSFSGPVVAKSSAYTATATDYTILVSGTTTITLPTSVGITGRQYTIKKTDTATVSTIATTSTQTIDGATTYVMATQYKYVTVQSDGTNWWVVGNN